MQDCEIVLLMEVKTFYQGEVRKGIVKSVAKKTSKRTGVKHYWIEFPDMIATKFGHDHGHAIKSANTLTMIRKRKERESTKKVLQRMNQKELLKDARDLDFHIKRVNELRKRVLPQLMLQLKEHPPQRLIDRGGTAPGNLSWLYQKMKRGYSHELKSSYVLPALKKLIELRQLMRASKPI